MLVRMHTITAKLPLSTPETDPKIVVDLSKKNKPQYTYSHTHKTLYKKNLLVEHKCNEMRNFLVSQ
jgi:hypothetical protein